MCQADPSQAFLAKRNDFTCFCRCSGTASLNCACFCFSSQGGVTSPPVRNNACLALGGLNFPEQNALSSASLPSSSCSLDAHRTFLSLHLNKKNWVFLLLDWFPKRPPQWKGEAQRHVNCLHFATEVALKGPPERGHTQVAVRPRRQRRSSIPDLDQRRGRRPSDVGATPGLLCRKKEKKKERWKLHSYLCLEESLMSEFTFRVTAPRIWVYCWCLCEWMRCVNERVNPSTPDWTKTQLPVSAVRALTQPKEKKRKRFKTQVASRSLLSQIHNWNNFRSSPSPLVLVGWTVWSAVARLRWFHLKWEKKPS